MYRYIQYYIIKILLYNIKFLKLIYISYSIIVIILLSYIHTYYIYYIKISSIFPSNHEHNINNNDDDEIINDKNNQKIKCLNVL